MRLTNQLAAALKVPDGKAYILVFDDDLAGFGLRASAGGSKVWVVQYRNALGQTKRETLGRVGIFLATDARRAANERLAGVRLGGDPASEREVERKRAAITVASQIEPYLKGLATRVRDTGVRESTRYLQKAWSPLHRTPVSRVTRAQVAEQLGEIARTSGLYAANRARNTLLAFYTWLIEEGIAEVNPVVGTRKPTPDEKRQRVLKPAEIQAVLRALPEGDFGQIVRLLLFTAQRRDEVAALPWEEVDLAAGLWSMPGARTKNGLPHPAAFVARLPATRAGGRPLANRTEWISAVRSPCHSQPTDDALTSNPGHRMGAGH